MRIIISAGSSGGHIYPALSLIKIIKQIDPKVEFLYVGRKDSLEEREVKKYDIPFFTIESYGFDRKNKFKNLRLIGLFIKNYFVLRKKIKQFQPDLVLGFGGHVTVPVIFVASKLKIKTFIHEQNKIMGKANLFLSKYVDAVLLSFPETSKTPKNVKTIYTGNPVMESALKTEKFSKTELGLDKNKKLILIILGSLGAKNVHQYLMENLKKLKCNQYQIVYITGPRNFDEKVANDMPKDIVVLAYFQDLVRLMKEADLVVSRAGATTLAEIIALRKPTLLIPSPFVPDNHQEYNANYLVEKKAAVMLPEKDLENLNSKIEKLISDPDLIKKIQTNLEKIEIDNSGQLIYNVLKQG